MQSQTQNKQNKQYFCSKYKCAQVFGSNQNGQVMDQDVISCLKYDPTGHFLCIGDCAGRVIIFQENKPDKLQDQIPNTTGQKTGFNTFDYYAQFQSHVRQFDPLKGIQSSEQIVGISWLRPQGKYLKFLTTNSKSIKYWKAFEKTEKKIVKSANKDLCMPKLQSLQPSFVTRQQYIFPTVHATQINSISHSNNQQYVLSTDEQKSYLWNLQKPTCPYIVNSISERRKTSTNQLTITCSSMHPHSDSIFAYGLNRCQIGLCDIRTYGNDKKVMNFGAETRSVKNFFTDMIATVGSVQFMQNGKYIISRQYLNVKVWDMNNTKKPLFNMCVQQSLKPKLVNLFESDNIFDKFTVCASKDNSTILTGNYNNNFHLLNLQNSINTQYQLNFNKNTISKQIIPGKCEPLTKLDCKRKTSALAYHPTNHSVAIATLNCFFIYSI